MMKFSRNCFDRKVVKFLLLDREYVFMTRHKWFSITCDDCGRESDKYKDAVQLERDLEEEGWELGVNHYCSNCKLDS